MRPRENQIIFSKSRAGIRHKALQSLSRKLGRYLQTICERVLSPDDWPP